MPENLDLPFDFHYAEGNESNPPCVIVWTTFEGGDTVDHVAVVDVPEDDPNADRSLRIAEFITKALNHYTGTPEGLAEWRKIHPLLPLQVKP